MVCGLRLLVVAADIRVLRRPPVLAIARFFSSRISFFFFQRRRFHVMMMLKETLVRLLQLQQLAGQIQIRIQIFQLSVRWTHVMQPQLCSRVDATRRRIRRRLAVLLLFCL